MGPPARDDRGPTPAHRPRSVVTTSRSSPMVGQYADNLPRPHLRGTWSTRSFPCSPANRPAPALDQLPWSPSSERGAAAGTHTKWQSRSGVDPRASHAWPTFDHPFPPGPIRAATTKPRTDHSDTSNPVRQCGRSRRTDGFRDPARSGQRGCSGCGHRTRVRPDTPDHPGRVDTGRLDTRRPPDQLDGRPPAWRTADADPATTAVAGVRTSWTATT